MHVILFYRERRWDMDNEIVYSSKATDQKAQYDASAKRLLGQKIILAHILIRVVEEFKGMDADTVALLIEGEPYISQVPVEPGLTNKDTVDARTGERIVGLNTESSEIDEGKIYFDIIFYVRMRDGLAKMIINLEAQKNEPTKYFILNRAIFYTARLVSSQKEREFTGSDYNEIKQVYSIWICMNMKENSLSHIHMVKDDLLGEQDWKGNLDILNIVMIGLAKEIPPREEKYELHRLLGTLLSQTMTAEQKLKLMKQEYDIPVDRHGIRDEVKIMCNLSEGVEEMGYAKGEAAGKAAGRAEGEKIGEARGKVIGRSEGRLEGRSEERVDIILKMHKKGYTLEQIMDVTDMSESEIKAIID